MWQCRGKFVSVGVCLLSSRQSRDWHAVWLISWIIIVIIIIVMIITIMWAADHYSSQGGNYNECSLHVLQQVVKTRVLLSSGMWAIRTAYIRFWETRVKFNEIWGACVRIVSSNDTFFYISRKFELIFSVFGMGDLVHTAVCYLVDIR